MLWDATTKAFYFVKEDRVTEFTFTSSKDGNMKATYADGKWTFTQAV
jgi:hypothetical protein